MENQLVRKMIQFIILSSIIFSNSITAEQNVNSGLECLVSDDSTSTDPFRSDLTVLLNILSLNGPVRGGFYTTVTGTGPSKIYGLVQCRGDVSPENCSNCIQETIETVLQRCPKSKQVKVWFNWCFLRFSDARFLNAPDLTSVAIYNDTDVDDASVGSKGLNFMSDLAVKASRQKLLFETAVLDVGESGKRYGLAQCNRDIGSGDCQKCLESQLKTFRWTVGNKRGWEIYGSSCSMWYHDFQFYFNHSDAVTNGARATSSDSVIDSVTMAMLVSLLLLFH